MEFRTGADATMPKTKKKAKAKSPPVHHRLLHGEGETIRHALRNNLYVLFEGDGLKRCARVYDRATGKVVATHFRATGRCLFAPGDFTENDPAAVMTRIRTGLDAA